jgi:hypothetical protein
VFCFFESGDGQVTRDGGKSLKKVLESFSALEVVEERLDGHSRSAKNGSSTKDIGVFNNDGHEGIVARASAGVPERQKRASGYAEGRGG